MQSFYDDTVDSIRAGTFIVYTSYNFVHFTFCEIRFYLGVWGP